MIPVVLLNFLISPQAVLANPAPVPLFLKAGFSSVLEFDAKPTRVVIGDSGSFQVERLDKSLVIRTLADSAITNLLVYFAGQPVRMFVLRASQDDEPALYRKFSLDRKPAITERSGATSGNLPLATRLLNAKFDKKHDFLAIKIRISASSAQKLSPVWSKVVLKANGASAKPQKVWSERREVQAGTFVDAQFTFRRPDLGAGQESARLEIPLMHTDQPLVINVGRVQ